MFVTRAFFTAAVIFFASPTVRANGFSHKIALPFLAAAIAISQCVSLGVQISMMSISGLLTRTRQSIWDFFHPSLDAALLTADRFRPQIVFISISAGRSKKRGACRHAFEWALPMKL